MAAFAVLRHAQQIGRVHFVAPFVIHIVSVPLFLAAAASSVTFSLSRPLSRRVAGAVLRLANSCGAWPGRCSRHFFPVSCNGWTALARAVVAGGCTRTSCGHPNVTSPRPPSSTILSSTATSTMAYRGGLGGGSVGGGSGSRGGGSVPATPTGDAASVATGTEDLECICALCTCGAHHCPPQRVTVPFSGYGDAVPAPAWRGSCSPQ